MKYIHHYLLINLILINTVNKRVVYHRRMEFYHGITNPYQLIILNYIKLKTSVGSDFYTYYPKMLDFLEPLIYNQDLISKNRTLSNNVLRQWDLPCYLHAKS